MHWSVIQTMKVLNMPKVPVRHLQMQLPSLQTAVYQNVHHLVTAKSII